MADAEVEAAEKRRRLSWIARMRWPLMIGGPLIILALVAWLAVNSGKSQSTEDAYVEIAKAPVAASVPGRVIDVLVKENQVVKKGDPLFRLDPRDFNAAAAASEAQLKVVYGQVLGLKADYAQAQAGVAQAQSRFAQIQQTVEFTAKEAARQQALFEAGVGSRDQAEQAAQVQRNAKQELTPAQAQVAAAQAAQTAAFAHSGNVPGQAPELHPMVQAAKANYDRALLNQSFTTVVALTDGVVTRVDQLQPGAYVNASQTVFWLLTGQPWIEANFKEDQLAHMKIGQPVTVAIDAYDGGKLAAHVASFAPGTGQTFSPLPAQNATGNWVKVAQRLPVRIEFDKTPPEMAGRAGLSARVKVDVTGPGKAEPAQAR